MCAEQSLLNSQKSVAGANMTAKPPTRCLLVTMCAAPQRQVLRTYLAAGALQGKSAPPERWGSYMAQAIAKFETPAAQGASFPALMGPAMALGALSRRQVHAEATAFERKRWGGWAPPGGVLHCCAVLMVLGCVSSCGPPHAYCVFM